MHKEMRYHILFCHHHQNCHKKAQYSADSGCFSKANIWNEIHYRIVVDNIIPDYTLIL